VEILRKHRNSLILLNGVTIEYEREKRNES
jgi:hypothetical protein